MKVIIFRDIVAMVTEPPAFFILIMKQMQSRDFVLDRLIRHSNHNRWDLHSSIEIVLRQCFDIHKRLLEQNLQRRPSPVSSRFSWRMCQTSGLQENVHSGPHLRYDVPIQKVSPILPALPTLSLICYSSGLVVSSCLAPARFQAR